MNWLMLWVLTQTLERAAAGQRDPSPQSLFYSSAASGPSDPSTLLRGSQGASTSLFPLFPLNLPLTLQMRSWRWVKKAPGESPGGTSPHMGR